MFKFFIFEIILNSRVNSGVHIVPMKSLSSILYHKNVVLEKSPIEGVRIKRPLSANGHTLFILGHTLKILKPKYVFFNWQLIL